MKITKVTVELLKQQEACKEHVELFERVFPNGAEITLENCLKAAHSNLDVEWIAQRLLKKSALKSFGASIAPAQKTYIGACSSAQIAYDEARASAVKDYYNIMANAMKAHEEAIASARATYARQAYNGTICPGQQAVEIEAANKAYDEAMAPVQKPYDEAMAPVQKSYDEATEPAKKAYDEAIAIAFYNAYMQQQ